MVLRRGSKKGLSRRRLEGRSTPFREYDPLGVCPMRVWMCSGHQVARIQESQNIKVSSRDPDTFEKYRDTPREGGNRALGIVL